MTNRKKCDIIYWRLSEEYVFLLDLQYADVAELADALDSGSSESNFMWVQVPSPAPQTRHTLLVCRVFLFDKMRGLEGER